MILAFYASTNTVVFITRRLNLCYSDVLSTASGCRPPAEETPQSGGTTEERAVQLQSYHSFLHNSFTREACLMRYAYA